MAPLLRILVLTLRRRAEQGTDRARNTHRQSAPYQNARRAADNGCPACARRERAQRSEKDERNDRDDEALFPRRQHTRYQWKDTAHCEAER